MSDPKTKAKPQAKPAMLPPGAYVNFLRVAQARSEFHLAFGQQAPGQAAQLLSTFVTTPLHAKAMPMVPPCRFFPVNS